MSTADGWGNRTSLGQTLDCEQSVVLVGGLHLTKTREMKRAELTRQIV